MKLAKIGLAEIVLFIGIVLLFINFGQSIGWRAVGIVQLVFSFYIIKKKRIGVGWEGFEPSFYITGVPAVLIGLLSIGISIMLLFYPEETIMRWGSK